MKNPFSVLAVIIVTAVTMIVFAAWLTSSNFEPFSVVCDEHGHYTATDEAGRPNEYMETENYAMAARAAEWYRVHDGLPTPSPVPKRKWQQCPKPQHSPALGEL